MVAVPASLSFAVRIPRGVKPLLALAWGGIRLFLLLSLSTQSRAADIYVAPDATETAPCTPDQPCSLAAAFLGQVGQPGDTIWLRGGDYRIGHLDTKIQGAAGMPITFRQVPGEKARVDGTLPFFGSPGYVTLRDFELYSSDTNRISQQTGVGFQPTDISPLSGISCYCPNCSFINLIVHDHTRHGFYISEAASNTVVYGCVVYNNGWVSPDNSEGHNFYVQSEYGRTEIAENLAFNNCGANFHVYENAVGGHLKGVILDGNTAFNAAALPTVRAYRDWVVGVDYPSISTDEISFKNNMGYLPPGSPTFTQVEIGREGVNGAVSLTGNYMPLGLLIKNWSFIICSSNVFAPQTSDVIVELEQNPALLAAFWNNNNYSHPWTGVLGADFQWNDKACTFDEWQSTTGFDSSSSFNIQNMTGTQVFVRTNRYEQGRAHIVVYNWDNLSQVAVDVGTFLQQGMGYEVRNAQDYSAPPVLEGTFGGERLVLPMLGLTVAQPNGPLLAPPPTGPTFNLFVIVPLFARLSILMEAGGVRISWPINSGRYVLESNQGFGGTNNWMSVTNEPVVFEDQFVVRNSLTAGQKFYRLRSY